MSKGPFSHDALQLSSHNNQCNNYVRSKVQLDESLSFEVDQSIQSHANNQN